jgi:hypothetical protein
MADNKPADPAKDGLQQEEKLEEMLDRLNQVHVQASLRGQSIRCCLRPVFVF